MNLSLSTLDPDVQSVEEYFSSLSDNEFESLLEIANSDLNDVSDDDLADISALSVNIFATELEVDPMVVMEDIDMINTIIKRFLSSVVIYSLISKGLLEKTDNEDIMLYKDMSFRNTEKGMILGAAIAD